ncbi:MAG TPA: hypothetical protein VGS80_05285 [Ktedonobacterales bacterium]|nr:hypothetical protein [Ktedonobacterales bacterium]
MWQEVRARLERALRAVFRRVPHGEPPGSPRGTRGQRYARFTDQQVGTGAPLDNG